MQEPSTKSRFVAAMAIYVLLAVLAGFTTRGVIRLATWIFLGGLALKTWLATLYRSD
ncbi:MAG TPA: hypothetical protein VHD76_17480 [Bryobacteraceae bacterium]|jgi:hypothetical protein|nr:hypothetical protein [Bryobacteraceae bacterium]